MEPQARTEGVPWRRFALGLVLASLGGAAFGLVYRQVAARAQVAKLERLPFMVTGWDRPSSEPVAAQEGVIVARLDMGGATIFRTGPVPVARGEGGQMLDAADARLPPWAARDEVRAAVAGNRTFGRYWVADGNVLVQTLAQPVPEGGALYIVTGLHMSKFRQPAVLAATTLIAGTFIILLALLLMGGARLAGRGPLAPRS